MEINTEISSFQAMFMLGAAAASALLTVVAIGLWGRILSTTARASRRAGLAADQLESTTIQLQEYMEIIELGAAESLAQPAEVENQQASAAQGTAPPAAAPPETAPAASGLENMSEGPKGSVADRLKQIIHHRRMSQLAQGAARSERPNAD